MPDERLQKYLSRCGVASRRRAEEMIRDGKVSVNGRTVSKMGFVVDGDKDRVFIEGKPVQPKKGLTYILLYKPAGVVSTCDDPRGRDTVTQLIGGKNRLFPVGRLDYETEGLLLLTDDGELANVLTHPKYGIPKTYRARVAGLLTTEKRDSLKNGLRLDDGMTKPAKVEVEYFSKEESCFYLTISEGRNRQVRRMCEALELPVLSLCRTRMGFLDLAGLQPGKHRYLKKHEIERLKAYANAPLARNELAGHSAPPGQNATTGHSAPPARNELTGHSAPRRQNATAGHSAPGDRNASGARDARSGVAPVNNTRGGRSKHPN